MKFNNSRLPWYLIQNGEFKLIRVDSIRVDPSYQRKVNQKNPQIVAMAANWSWPCVDPFTVNARNNGTIYSLDCYGRLMALGMKYPGYLIDGKPIYVMARVMHLETVEEEAVMSAKLNGYKRIYKGDDRFKAFHRGKQPVETACVAIFKDNGILLDHDNSARNNVCRSLAAVSKAYTKLGDAKFRDMAKIISSYRRPDNADVIESKALKASFIGGLVMFLCEYGGSVSTAIQGLRLGFSAAQIVDLGIRDSKGLGWGRKKAMRDAFFRSHSHGMGKAING